MTIHFRPQLLSAFALLGLLACGSSEDDPAPSNPAQDASSDAGQHPDAARDAAADVPIEGAVEAALDVAQDTIEDGAADGSNDAAPDGPPCTLAKPYSSSNAACNECAERECCEEVNDCLLDPVCDDSYVNCILACSIDVDAGEVAPCIAVCDEEYPEGKAKFDAAIGCADTRCAAECG